MVYGPFARFGTPCRLFCTFLLAAGGIHPAVCLWYMTYREHDYPFSPRAINHSRGVYMEKYRINGGLPLYGAVDISGAKNAVVAILPAVILSDEPCRIENIPNINDVSTSLRILRSLGAEVNRLDRHTVQIDPRPICTGWTMSWRAPCEHRIILSAHCWASAAVPAYPCRAAAGLACGRLTCT